MRTSIPSQMKAATIERYGGPEVLHTRTIPVPQPEEDEVLLRVDTAGIGVWDPWIREGGFAEEYGGSAHFPYVIGNDGAGEVVAVGSKVRRLHVGDVAYGYSMDGGFYAEYVTLKESAAAKIPKGLDAREAGALGADGITCLRGLDALKVKEGQSLMIIGASGGIGHLAVQLAKRMGVRVFAVASHPDGVALVSRLGADAVIDGREQDILKSACEFSPKGIDAALVLAGGDEVNRALKAIKKRGRVAHPNGVEPLPVAPKGITAIAYDGEPSEEMFERLNAMIGDKPFHVALGKTYSLDQAATAHREVAQHHLGKYAFRVH